MFDYGSFKFNISHHKLLVIPDQVNAAAAKQLRTQHFICKKGGLVSKLKFLFRDYQFVKIGSIWNNLWFGYSLTSRHVCWWRCMCQFIRQGSWGETLWQARCTDRSPVALTPFTRNRLNHLTDINCQKNISHLVFITSGYMDITQWRNDDVTNPTFL